MILQIGIVLGVCFLGQVIEKLLPFPFPGSVISLVLLFILLCTGLLRQEHIKEKSNFLLQNMAFFFIPSGVGIVTHFDTLRDSILSLLLVCVLTTVITFAATAFTVKGVMRLMERNREKGGRTE